MKSVRISLVCCPSFSGCSFARVYPLVYLLDLSNNVSLVAAAVPVSACLRLCIVGFLSTNCISRTIVFDYYMQMQDEEN
jgi:hypothetical protein